jgi:hypothetical protein
MTRIVEAKRDPALGARIVASRELRYDEGANESLDRPAHVRAASDLAWVGERLVVLQDDANFLGLYDPASGRVGAVTLPAGEDGRRQFDELRGTKALKLDLEGCTVVPGPDGPLLLAFGSGSSDRRELVMLVDRWEGENPRVRVRNAHELYDHLHGRTDFAGSELNLEGVVFVDGVVRLLQRGNGAPQGDLTPVDATGDLDWDALGPYLLGESDAPPELTNVVQYRLGDLHGHGLTFTSGVAGPAGIVYAASAEDSPDAVHDGPVVGSVLGVLAADGAARFRRRRGPLHPGHRRRRHPVPHQGRGARPRPEGSAPRLSRRRPRRPPRTRFDLRREAHRTLGVARAQSNRSDRPFVRCRES